MAAYDLRITSAIGYRKSITHGSNQNLDRRIADKETGRRIVAMLPPRGLSNKESTLPTLLTWWRNIDTNKQKRNEQTRPKASRWK
jgi:hypothetical protein